MGAIAIESKISAPAEPTRATRWTDARISVILFVGLFAIYVSVTRGQQYAYDGNSMLAVTFNLVNHGSLKTVGAFDDTFHASTPYSPYGIGMSILGIVPYSLSKALGHAPVLIAMVNPLITAAAGVVTFRIARVLGWRASEGLMAATAYGLLSMALQYTTEYFSEPAVTLCVLVMVLGVIRWGQGSPSAPLVVGVAAGAALQFRSDSLLTVWIGLLAIPFFVPWRTLLDRKALAQLVGPLIVSLGLLAAYNELRYSKLYVSSYGGAFVTPLGQGLHGLLLTSGKSLFVFNPLAVLGVVGLVLLYFHNRAVAVLFTLLIVTRLVFFARWSAWQGGWCWGPRFLLPIVPLLMLAAVEVLRSTRRRAMSGTITRVVAAVLTAASIVVSYLSIRVPYEQWLQVSAYPTEVRKLGVQGLGGTWQVAQNQWFLDTEYHPDANPIWGNIELLRIHAAEMAPILWREGYGVVGGVVALCGLAAVVGAFYGAQRQPRHSGRVTSHGSEAVDDPVLTG